MSGKGNGAEQRSGGTGGLVRYGEGGADTFPNVDATADVSPEAMVHPTAKIGPGARVGGGRNGREAGRGTEVHAGAEIHTGACAENSVIGPGSVLAEGAEVHNSTLGKKVYAGPDCVLSDCLAGDAAIVNETASVKNCRIEPGVNVASAVEINRRSREADGPHRVRAGGAGTDPSVQWQMDAVGNLRQLKDNLQRPPQAPAAAAAEKYQRPEIHDTAIVGSKVTLNGAVVIGEKAEVRGATEVGAGAEIGARALVNDHARVAPGASVGPGALIRKHETVEAGRRVPPRIHPTAVIDPTAIVDKTARIGPGCRIGPGAEIRANCDIGYTPDGRGGPTEIGADTVVLKNSKIEAGAVIGAKTLVGEMSRVGNATIGTGCTLGLRAQIGGGSALDAGARTGEHTKIGRRCRVGPGAVIGDDCRMGDDTFVGAEAQISDRVGVEGGTTGVTIDDVHHHLRNRTIIGEGASIGEGCQIAATPTKEAARAAVEADRDRPPGAEPRTIRIEAVGKGAVMERDTALTKARRLSPGERLTKMGRVPAPEPADAGRYGGETPQRANAPQQDRSGAAERSAAER